MSRYMSLIVLAMASLNAVATDEPSDTVYFYNTWQHVLNVEADTMIVDPVIDVCSPYEIYVETTDKKVNKRIKKEYIAATLGGSIWLINSQYLKDYFKGDSKKLHGYVPLFFNDKVAYAVFEEYMYAEVGDIAYNVISTYNFYIDFVKRKVIRVDPKALSALLTDYPDLKMRYEGMKNSKRISVIDDYFLEYVDRVSEDALRPEIVDLLRDKGL